MDYKEAIEHTKNKKGMKVDFAGSMSHRAGGQSWRNMISEHYYLAREAWLNGDLETVAEFFGLYV